MGVCTLWLTVIDWVSKVYLSEWNILPICLSLYQGISLPVCLSLYLYHYNSSVYLSMYLSIYSLSFASIYFCLRVCCRHVQRPPGEPLAGSPVGSLGRSEAWGGGEARQGPLLRQQDLNAVLIDVGKLSVRVLCVFQFNRTPRRKQEKKRESRLLFRVGFFFRSRTFIFVFTWF